MNKKFAVILLGAALGAALLTGCGKSDRESEKKMSHGWEEKDTVYGEVSKAAEDLITIKVGTRKEMERPKEESSQKAAESKVEEKPSMLELTGEEQVIKLTEETVLKRQAMKGLPGNGTAPQKPDGEQGKDNGELPQKPDGEPPQEPGESQENSSEDITVSDISEGDIVMVTFTDDKKAAQIKELSVKEGSGLEVNPPAGEQNSGTGTV